MDKKQFFAATKRATEQIQVDGYGAVNISALTLSQRTELPRRFAEEGAKTVAWIVACGVDDFDESDIPSINEMDHNTLDVMAGAILRISGLSDDAVEEAKND